jgi:hypothetical protein
MRGKLLSEFYPSYYKLTILSVSCYRGIQLYPEAAIGSSRPLEAYDYLSSSVVVVVVRGRPSVVVHVGWLGKLLSQTQFIVDWQGLKETWAFRQERIGNKG